MTNRLRIAVILGGWSSEREISLLGGQCICKALDREKYEVATYDPLKELQELVEHAKKIDLAFNVLHGRFGEDGRIQGLLDVLGVPYVGSGVLASAMAGNKRLTKSVYKNEGLSVAKDVVLRKGADFPPNDILNLLGKPVVVKPVEGGSSLGMSVCNNEQELIEGMEKAFEFGNEIMVEEHIKGREISCCILGKQKVEALPIIEIIPKERYLFFDYEAKYKTGESEEICPAELGIEIEDRVRHNGIRAHKALGCCIWSRTDMIIRDNDIYLLETNTIPGMTENSLFPLAAKNAGMSFSGLVEKLIALSMENSD